MLAGAVFLSAAGDLLVLIVLALQVHELTGSGLAVAALFATTLVPVLALAPLAGLVADRCESVRVLVAARRSSPPCWRSAATWRRSSRSRRCSRQATRSASRSSSR